MVKTLTRAWRIMWAIIAQWFHCLILQFSRLHDHRPVYYETILGPHEDGYTLVNVSCMCGKVFYEMPGHEDAAETYKKNRQKGGAR